jgi:hypothetical protein
MIEMFSLERLGVEVRAKQREDGEKEPAHGKRC